MRTALPHLAYPGQDRDFFEIYSGSFQTCKKVNFNTGVNGSRGLGEGEMSFSVISVRSVVKSIYRVS